MPAPSMTTAIIPAFSRLSTVCLSAVRSGPLSGAATQGSGSVAMPPATAPRRSSRRLSMEDSTLLASEKFCLREKGVRATRRLLFRVVPEDVLAAALT